jgi:hypothetical protein
MLKKVYGQITWVKSNSGLRELYKNPDLLAQKTGMSALVIRLEQTKVTKTIVET